MSKTKHEKNKYFLGNISTYKSQVHIFFVVNFTIRKFSNYHRHSGLLWNALSTCMLKLKKIEKPKFKSFALINN